VRVAETLMEFPVGTVSRRRQMIRAVVAAE
jgi:hypothetical protein